MDRQVWRWVLGLIYIVAVATIWIAASFVVQSVVSAGVSPFLITYICNSLFVVYLPIVEIARYLEDSVGNLWFWRSNKNVSHLQRSIDSEEIVLLSESDVRGKAGGSNPPKLLEQGGIEQQENSTTLEPVIELTEAEEMLPGQEGTPTFLGVAKNIKNDSEKLDAKGRWTRIRVAWVGLLICPFWFLAQLTFNLSLKYTTVTSNTILSSASSLFTFLVSLVFLGEKFTWVKLISVLLCMGGTVIVSLSDSKSKLNATATYPLLGDILALVSSGFYAVYITLIRVKLPDDDGKNGHVSMAQFLGFVGLFNLLIFLPVALILNFTKLEPFHTLTRNQFGLIVGKGLLDNVISDYLWAKAVLLTTTTVATAGLTIQVPMAAIVDSLTGHPPHVMDYLGAAAVLFGFAGINIPSDACSPKDVVLEREDESVDTTNQDQRLQIGGGTTAIS